jgi:hypothetical protein
MNDVEGVTNPQASADAGSTERLNLRELLTELGRSGRAWAEAEGRKQSLKAGVVGRAIRDIVIFAVVAVILLLAILGALLVGLILTLSAYMPPLGATAVVLAGALCVVALLVLMAWAKVRGMIARIKL